MAIWTVGPNSSFPTIDAAMAVASPGDTIVLEPGYSTETATVTHNDITVQGTDLSQGIELQLAPGVTGLLLTGDAPMDVLDNGIDNNFVGNEGDNEFTVIGGIVHVDGGEGNDRLIIDYHTETGTITGNATTAFTAADGRSVSVETGTVEHFTILAGSGVNTLTTATGDDYIQTAGAGDNIIAAGDGNNTILTGSGIDTITVGSGNDTILAGDGANTIAGLGGDKIITTGAGVDTISVTDGNNTINAGAGANTISATSGNNTITTGAGVDTITVTSGNNTINAGDGANTITATSGDNTIIGGKGVDTITVTDGNNYIDAGDGANTIAAGTGNDTIVSGVDIDTIATGVGDDTIIVRGGTDDVAGGAGTDTLVVDYSATTADVTSSIPAGSLAAGYGGNVSQGAAGTATYAGIENFDITTGSGNDSITTGDGNDTINTASGVDHINTGGGADLVFGSAGDVIDGGEAGTDSDTLDLTGVGPHEIVYDPLNGEKGTVYVLDSDGTRNGDSLSFTNIEHVVACFTYGTLINTSLGALAIETLKVGDMVLTLDNGFKPVLWIGTKTLSGHELIQNDALQPIFIGRGALGYDRPQRDTMVSRQHRMLVSGPRAELLFGSNEVLVKASHLLSLPGIKAARLETVTYVHIMFDRHEIVLADGAWSESFQPGDLSIAGLDAEQRQELEDIFPEFSNAGFLPKYDAARSSLKGYEARVLPGFNSPLVQPFITINQ